MSNGSVASDLEALISTSPVARWRATCRMQFCGLNGKREGQLWRGRSRDLLPSLLVLASQHQVEAHGHLAFAMKRSVSVSSKLIDIILIGLAKRRLGSNAALIKRRGPNDEAGRRHPHEAYSHSVAFDASNEFRSPSTRYSSGRRSNYFGAVRSTRASATSSAKR